MSRVIGDLDRPGLDIVAETDRGDLADENLRRSGECSSRGDAERGNGIPPAEDLRFRVSSRNHHCSSSPRRVKTRCRSSRGWWDGSGGPVQRRRQARHRLLSAAQGIGPQCDLVEPIRPSLSVSPRADRSSRSALGLEAVPSGSSIVPTATIGPPSPIIDICRAPPERSEAQQLERIGQGVTVGFRTNGSGADRAFAKTGRCRRRPHNRR